MAVSIQTHLSRCAGCQKELQIIREGIRLAQQLRSVPAPEGLWESIEEKIKTDRWRLAADESQTAYGGRHFWVKLALGLGGVFLISTVSWLYLHDRSDFLGRIKSSIHRQRDLGGVPGAPQWSISATIIEACSCPMFCQCYFNTKPAAHGHGEEKHFCRTNMAYKVNKGHYGSVKLDGLKFWLAADVGADFSQRETDWGVLYFDTIMTREQRDAVKAIMDHVYPVKWKSYMTAEGRLDTWELNNDTARATLDNGATAEIKLRRFPGNTDDPIVIQNLRYWAAPRNDGFVLMPNEIEAYRVGPKAFEFKGTNGFIITFSMNSNDVVRKVT